MRFKFIQQNFYRLLRKSPLFGYPLLKKRFNNEILLLKNKHKNFNTHQSIIFFTLHKCASIYVGNILRKITKDAGMTAIKFPAYFFLFGNPEDVYQMKKAGKWTYKEKGYFYGPIRMWIPEIPNIDNYMIVLMLRDPRDVLVSLYFSTAYSHSIPYENKKRAKEMFIDREKALNMTVDEFVLEQADIYLSRYQIYCKELLNKKNVLFTKYEDMIYDFKKWLGFILNFLKFEVKQETIEKIINKQDFDVQTEDITKHKRQVVPGDYKRKLQPATIKKLNLKYKVILERLDYKIESY